MAKYNVFESTNMGTTHYAERILDAVCENDVENGTFGYLTGVGDIKTFVAGLPSNGEQIVVVDQPAWTELMVNGLMASDKRRDKFICEANVPFRVRVVKRGDTFATAIEGVTSATKTVMESALTATSDSDETPIVVYLTIDTTGKLVAKTSSTDNAVFEAVVEKVRICGGTLVTSLRNYGYSTKMYECTVKTLA